MKVILQKSNVQTANPSFSVHKTPKQTHEFGQSWDCPFSLHSTYLFIKDFSPFLGIVSILAQVTEYLNSFLGFNRCDLLITFGYRSDKYYVFYI